MVRLTGGVRAARGLEINPRHRTPPDGQHDLRRLIAGCMSRGIAHDARDHDRVDPFEAYRLGRRGRIGRGVRIISRVLVGVTDDESTRRQRKHRDVTAQLIAIERGLVVHQVVLQGLTRECGVQRIRDQVRVIAASLDVHLHSLTQIRHPAILPPSQAPSSQGGASTRPLAGRLTSVTGDYGERVMAAEDRAALWRMSPEVAEATALGAPVVALESTIISHGLPRPENLRVARAVEATIRALGAVPATIAIIDGLPHIGLTPEELELIALRDGIMKVSVRDLATIVASGGSGATTVAATCHLARAAGIEVFATGGLGGVHRQARESWDESADLTTLGSTRITVICAGVKSILDVPATLERLETLNVTVLGYCTDDFPGFYLSSSGFRAPARADSAEEIADVMRAQRLLDVEAAIVVCAPLDPQEQLDPALHEEVLRSGLDLARQAGVQGKDVTPFLLDHFHRATHGESLLVNERIILRNAELAARIAVANAVR